MAAHGHGPQDPGVEDRPRLGRRDLARRRGVVGPVTSRDGRAGRDRDAHPVRLHEHPNHGVPEAPPTLTLAEPGPGSAIRWHVSTAARCRWPQWSCCSLRRQLGRSASPRQLLEEWEDVRVASRNTEAPHAWFLPFDSEDGARQAHFRNSPWVQSLNGTWKFKWVPKPADRPAGFQRRPLRRVRLGGLPCSRQLGSERLRRAGPARRSHRVSALPAHAAVRAARRQPRRVLPPHLPRARIVEGAGDHPPLRRREFGVLRRG